MKLSNGYQVKKAEKDLFDILVGGKYHPNALRSEMSFPEHFAYLKNGDDSKFYFHEYSQFFPNESESSRVIRQEKVIPFDKVTTTNFLLCAGVRIGSSFLAHAYGPVQFQDFLDLGLENVSSKNLEIEVFFNNGVDYEHKEGYLSILETLDERVSVQYISSEFELVLV